MRCCQILIAGRTTTALAAIRQLAAAVKAEDSIPGSATFLKPSLAGEAAECGVDRSLAKMPRFALGFHCVKPVLALNGQWKSHFLFTVMTAKEPVPALARRPSAAVSVAVLVKFDESVKACSAKWSLRLRACAAKALARLLPTPVIVAVVMGE
jgi:hypothetical protein